MKSVFTVWKVKAGRSPVKGHERELKRTKHRGDAGCLSHKHVRDIEKRMIRGV